MSKKDPDIVPDNEWDRSIGGMKRTCPYCRIQFRTASLATDHFEQCPVRIRFGYVDFEPIYGA